MLIRDGSIVFVHGVGGHPYRTWTAASLSSDTEPSFRRRVFKHLKSKSRDDQIQPGDRHNPIFWPKDLLAQDLPDARISTYGYDADVSVLLSQTGDHSIFSIARNLIVRLESFRDTSGTDHIPIIFIAHSLGGIIVKDALKFSQDQAGFQNHLSSIFTATYGVIFFGTPHRGSNMASMGILAARITGLGMAVSKQHLLRSLEMGSPELERIADSFSRMLSRSGKSLNIYSFQEGLPLSGMSFAGKVVEDYSSTIGDAFEGKATIKANHMDMCRFKSRDNTDYDLVCSVIRRWTKSAVKGKGRQTENQTVRTADNDITEEPSNTRARIQSEDSSHEKISFQSVVSSLFIVPQVPVRNFLGRDHELNQIKQYFNDQSQSTYHQNIVVLYGLGGVGKTQLSLVYAYQHRKDYNAIFWINSKDEQTIIYQFRSIAQCLVDWAAESQKAAVNFTRIAYELGLGQFVSPTTGEVIVNSSNERLLIGSIKSFFEREHNSGWLLIFDAVDNLEEIDLPKFLPNTSHGNVLISSRRRQASQLGQGISVECLQDNDAREVLAKADSLDNAQDHQSAYESIAKLLGNLPLALSQAASYMATTQTSPQDYLSLYQQQRKEILRQKPAKALWQYEETVFTTWEISFLAISRAFPAAAQLLLISSFYDHENINYLVFEGARSCETHRARIWASLGPKRRSLVKRALATLPGFSGQNKRRSTSPIRALPWLKEIVEDNASFRRAISMLVDYSLIIEDISKSSFSMHSLVHTWCKIRKNPQYEIHAMDAMLTLGRTVDVELGPPETWFLVKQVYLHIIPVANTCMELDLGRLWKDKSDMSFPHALETLGNCLAYVQRSGQVLSIYQYCYKYMRIMCKLNNPMSLLILAKIATAMESKGDYQEAESIHLDLVERARASLGRSNSDTLTYLGDLGANLIAQSRYTESKHLLEYVAWTRSQVDGLEAAVPHFINLAVTNLELGELDAAMEALDLAMNGQMQLKSTDITNLLHILGWQATGWVKKGDRKRAEAILTSAVELAQSNYGNSHPLALQWRNNLVQFWTEDISCLDDELIEKINTISAQLAQEWSLVLGPLDYYSSQQLWRLGLFFYNLGEFSTSLSLLENALHRIEEESTSNPSTAMETSLGQVLRSLGKLRWDRGYTHDSIELYERAFRLLHHKIIPACRDLGFDVLNDLAVAYRDSGRLVEAESTLEHVISEQNKNGQEVDFLIKNNLATVFMLQGRHRESEQLFLELISAAIARDGPEDHAVLLIRHNLAILLERTGRVDEAINLLEQVFESKQIALRLRSPATLKTAIFLGRLYRMQGRVEEAARLADTIRPYLEYA